MSECNPSILSAYVDRELDDALRNGVDEHVAGCATCANELEDLRGLSDALEQYSFDDITPGELARVHDAIDDSADAPVWRLGGAIGVIAASVLIISAAWLVQMPASPPQRAQAVSPQESWERVAMTLRVDSVPSMDEPIQFADAHLDDWMLDALSEGER